jgi:hypothetical protein
MCFTNEQVCVIKSFPQPFGDTLFLDKDKEINQNLDNSFDSWIWFCPHHHCTICECLQSTSYSLTSIVLPRPYYTRKNSITQRTLRACSRCPFSVCNDCERSNLGVSGSFFCSKRGISVIFFFSFSSSNCKL